MSSRSFDNEFETVIIEAVRGDAVRAVIYLGLDTVLNCVVKVRGIEADDIETFRGQQAFAFLNRLTIGTKAIMKFTRPFVFDEFIADIYIGSLNVTTLMKGSGLVNSVEES